MYRHYVRTVPSGAALLRCVSSLRRHVHRRITPHHVAALHHVATSRLVIASPRRVSLSSRLVVDPLAHLVVTALIRVALPPPLVVESCCCTPHAASRLVFVASRRRIPLAPLSIICLIVA